MDNKWIWKFVLYSVIIMLLFPIITNGLMFVGDFKVAGDDKTWIGYLGSFWGAILGGIISGTITLMGVRTTINHNEELRNKENFPNKLYRLEKLISYLENTYKEFEDMMALDFGEKRSFFYSIDTNYNLYKSERFYRYTNQLFEKLNEDIVYVDSKTYKMFFEFRRKVNDLYQEVMWDVEYNLFEFTQDLIDKFIGEDINPMYINWEELSLNDDQKSRLSELKRQLNKSEKKYIYCQSEMIQDLKYQITDHYMKLIDEMNY